MIWYGLKTIKKNLFFLIRNNKLKTNVCNKKNAKFFKLNKNLNKFNINIYIPYSWQLSVISSVQKQPTYYFSNDIYFFLLRFYNFNFLFLDVSAKKISLLFPWVNNYNLLFFKFLSSIFYNFFFIFFKKIKFKGKGYYIFKNLRNTVTFQFGYSHRVYIYAFYVNVKFLSKTIFILFGLNKFDVIKNAFKLFYVRPLNIFTGKGVRFAKQIIYKKTGKVSSYR